MSELPSRSMYHRWLGWHAVDIRRTLIVGAIGVVVGFAVLPALGWGLASVTGWDAAACAFLITTWPIIVAANGRQTRELAVREDDSRGTATVLQLSASVASLGGVGLALTMAGRTNGARQLLLIGFAVLTVVLSWLLINTTYTLRYAHLQYRKTGSSIEFDDTPMPTYRDFAYVAFTIGMTYQVADTNLKNRHVRGTVMSHALLAYLFGVVIVAGVINLIAGFAR